MQKELKDQVLDLFKQSYRDNDENNRSVFDKVVHALKVVRDQMFPGALIYDCMDSNITLDVIVLPTTEGIITWTIKDVNKDTSFEIYDIDKRLTIEPRAEVRRYLKHIRNTR